MSTYKYISSFGQPAANNILNNPLTYCTLQTVSTGFLHGGIGETISGKYGQNCQSFMSSYCARPGGWDNICEFASQDTNTSFPNNLSTCGENEVVARNMTAGEVLIRNTAARKYLAEMIGGCKMQYQPFDPTVASSPLVGFWEGNSNCIPVYEVDPSKIDNDPVMNKILMKPIIAWGILVNIYNTAVRKNTLNTLKGTKLYNLFQTAPFQKYMQNLKSAPFSSANRCV